MKKNVTKTCLCWKKTLLKKEKILSVGKGKFIAPAIQQESAEGTLEITTTGRGYVVCEDLDGDVMIEQRNLNKGLHGDIVRVVTGKKNSKNKYEGKIVEVIERKKEVFVGVFQKSKEYAFVNTRNARMYTDFFITREEMKDYKDGEKVAVEIKSWEKPKDSPQGRIIKSFGFGDDALDAYSILYEYGLSTEFEEEVEQEAAKIKPVIKKEEIKKRRDMRGAMTFTIDPVDAKVSLKRGSQTVETWRGLKIFKNLAVGTYQISAEINGYEANSQNFTILKNKNHIIEIKLKKGFAHFEKR